MGSGRSKCRNALLSSNFIIIFFLLLKKQKKYAIIITRQNQPIGSGLCPDIRQEVFKVKKKTLTSVLSLLLAMITAIMMAGCESGNPSNTNYWFSETKTEFAAYDEDADNIDKAGSYWYFTSAKDAVITMNVIMNVDNLYSAAYLYLNDTQIKSETDTGIYTYSYKLSLKKGDKIKIHAFWTNSLKTDDKGFEFINVSITENGKTYNLTEFDKSSKYTD